MRTQLHKYERTLYILFLNNNQLHDEARHTNVITTTFIISYFRIYRCDYTRFWFARAAEMARSKYGFEKDCKELIKTLTEFKVPENVLTFDIVF